MEKSTRNLSSCHVQTRPAYQALSANMLSSLSQLDPARQRASRRHTPTSYREKGTLCSWPRLKNVFTSTESIISTQLYAASCTHSSSPEQTVVKKLFIALLELLCGVGGWPFKRRCRWVSDRATHFIWEAAIPFGLEARSRLYSSACPLLAASTKTQKSGRGTLSDSAMRLSGIVNFA